MAKSYAVISALFNATLYMDKATGKPVDAPPVRQSRLMPVDEGSLVAAVQSAIKASDDTDVWHRNVSYGNASS